MKKNLLSVIALICAVCALVAALIAGITAGRLQSQVEALTRSNEALESQIRELSGGLERFFVEPAVIGVDQWSLTPDAWSDGNGANVTLTMTPIEYDPNIAVRFVIQMDQQPIADIPCAWDGSAYTATAGLTAMNGYSYSCVFESASGTDTQFLASPDAPTVPEAVNLADSLNSYSSMLIDNWSYADDVLTITDGYVQVQMPLIGSRANARPEAVLILKRSSETLHQVPVELTPGEGDGSYEAELSALAFELPALSDEDVLELWLDVTVNGETQSDCGAEWYPENGELLLTAG